MKYRTSVHLLLAVSIIGCLSDDRVSLPEHLQDLENVIVRTLLSDQEAIFDIELIREYSYGDNDEVNIGHVPDVGLTVDDDGRVYILDHDQNGIHVFQPDGTYRTFLGGRGSGPGEFQFQGAALRITSNQLVVLDQGMLRVTYFDLNELEVDTIVNVRYPDRSEIFEELEPGQARLVSVVDRIMADGTFLINFRPLIYSDETDPRYNYEDDRYGQYYLMDVDGRILSEKVFELRGRQRIRDRERRGNSGAVFEFLGKPLLTLSEDDHIYMAWSEEFLVQVYNPEGLYLRTYYVPFNRVALDRDDAIRNVRDIFDHDFYEAWVQNIELPDFWPALAYMTVDSQNRMWIASISEEYGIFQWWVLNEGGELVTAFRWPRHRIIEKVKGDFLYTRELDEWGEISFVRYRIEMEEIE